MNKKLIGLGFMIVGVIGIGSTYIQRGDFFNACTTMTPDDYKLSQYYNETHASFTVAQYNCNLLGKQGEEVGYGVTGVSILIGAILFCIEFIQKPTS